MNRKSLQIMTVVGVLALALPVAAMAQGESQGGAAAPEQATTAAPAKKVTRTSQMRHVRRAWKVNLNTASRERLMKLPGVTEKIADEIIAARPLKKESDLMSRNIVTRAEWSKIQKHVTLKSTRMSRKEAKSKTAPAKTETSEPKSSTP